MTDLYLLEPAPSSAWFPFSDCRPVSELRAGAWLIRERWEAIAQGETKAVFGPDHLHGFVEDGAPPVTAWKAVEGPALIGLSVFAPGGTPPEAGDGPARLVHEGTTVGWMVPRGKRWEGDHTEWPEVEIEGLLLRGSHDLVTALEHLLVADTADFTVEHGDPVPDGCTVIGDPADIVILGATIEPGTVFDVREGAVVIEQHAYVKSGTRFEGPVYVGPATEVFGGQIRWCSFGPRCKVRGELSTTVFLGFANKAHDGFVGHSVIGRWVNLGAGTVTSNLKNTYGKVRLQVGGEGNGGPVIETDRQYLGSIIGDHVKTAIGTLFATGTVVGTGANVFGDIRPPKCVPAFAWGGSDAHRLEERGFLATTERVMGRRNVKFSDPVKQMLQALYRHAVGGG
jgi:UDP-N-acetylglucosamine diphosphorylase/glucosamine-1-phosphate N-acetyltransferase